MTLPEFTFTMPEETPSMRNLMDRWIGFVKDGVKREEARLEALRQEVLKEPLPELTGEQWARRVVDAMKALCDAPLPESYDPEHPAKRALDVAYIQAHAAGWNITMDGPDEAESALTLSPSGMLELNVTFTKPTDSETPSEGP